MVRARDDLCITIHRFFKCPISFILMKSLVILCTRLPWDSCRAFYSARLFSLFRALVLGFHELLLPLYFHPALAIV
ncbi:hypothetical protein JHK85_024870 [Glycine max]|nr:hypothetical protein JHK85_024870 [Glycine max]